MCCIVVDEPRVQRDPLAPTDPDQERASRVDAALSRLVERHAGTDTARRRHQAGDLVAAHELVRLVSRIGGGTVDLVDNEPGIDQTDLVAAMTLLPVARSEIDELEAALLFLAREQGMGMTWSQIAFALGLRSPQAERERDL